MKQNIIASSEKITRQKFDPIFKQFALKYFKEVGNNICWAYHDELKRFTHEEIVAGFKRAIDHHKDYFPTSAQVKSCINTAIADTAPTYTEKYAKSFADVKTPTKCGADHMNLIRRFFAGEVNKRELAEEQNQLIRKHKLNHPEININAIENPEHRIEKDMFTQAQKNAEHVEKIRAVKRKEASKKLAGEIEQTNGVDIAKTILPVLDDIYYHNISEAKVEKARNR